MIYKNGTCVQIRTKRWHKRTFANRSFLQTMITLHTALCRVIYMMILQNYPSQRSKALHIHSWFLMHLTRTKENWSMQSYANISKNAIEQKREKLSKRKLRFMSYSYVCNMQLWSNRILSFITKRAACSQWKSCTSWRLCNMSLSTSIK